MKVDYEMNKLMSEITEKEEWKERLECLEKIPSSAMSICRVGLFLLLSSKMSSSCMRKSQ